MALITSISQIIARYGKKGHSNERRMLKDLAQTEQFFYCNCVKCTDLRGKDPSCAPLVPSLPTQTRPHSQPGVL